MRKKQVSKCAMGQYVNLLPINDTSSVFWPSDTGSRINELRFSDYVSLSFKTKLMSMFCGDIT